MSKFHCLYLNNTNFFKPLSYLLQFLVLMLIFFLIIVPILIDWTKPD